MTDQTIKGTVLVVDDTPANLHLLRNILTQQGYKVRPIPNGMLALDALQSFLPDLILLDIMMPDMDGYEVCQRLKANDRTKDIPVIFISAIDELVNKVKAFEVGGVDYITKPFQADEVLARIKTHLTIQIMQKKLQQAHDELEVRVDELSTLNMIIHAVATTTNLNKTLQNIAGNIMRLFEMKAVSIGLLDPTKTELTLITQNERPEDDTHVVGLTVPIINDPLTQQMIEKGETIIITEAQTNPIIAALHAVMRARQITSIMVVPLVSRAGVVGTINLSSNVENYEFDDTQIQLTETIAGQIVGAIENVRLHEEQQQANIALSAANKRMQEDLVLARSIQQGLLPPPRPDWSQLEVICFTASANEIGGDFYAYHRFENESIENRQSKIGYQKYALAVGDVSGKGVSAALLMAASLSQLEAMFAYDYTPAKRLTYLDEAIMHYARPRCQNCALCYVQLEVRSRGKTSPPTPYSLLHVINAGCIPPYVKRADADGSVEFDEKMGGFALGQGLGAKHGYREHTIELFSGDMVILISDGVVEANNKAGDMLGFERLEQIVRNFEPDTSFASQDLQGFKNLEGLNLSGAEAMLEHLKREVFAFTGEAEQHDDMTMVVVRV
ncbi:response regulator [Anaerolineales bacterium HSG24]|nr:response regulator [Anaerolineales bacterium HSG24]